VQITAPKKNETAVSFVKTELKTSFLFCKINQIYIFLQSAHPERPTDGLTIAIAYRTLQLATVL